jgi:biotin carboxyl carrier protein
LVGGGNDDVMANHIRRRRAEADRSESYPPDTWRDHSLRDVAAASAPTSKPRFYAKVAGYLKSLSVDKGDRVQAGQSLGEIEVPELLVTSPNSTPS